MGASGGARAGGGTRRVDRAPPPAARVRGDSPSAPERADLQIKKGTNRSRSVCFVFPSGKRTRREHSHGANAVFTFFLVAFFM